MPDPSRRRGRRRPPVAALAALWLWPLSLAPQAWPANAGTPPLEELVVSGEQPGPALWQVRRGDHVMWVLGVVSPLPVGLEWRSREAEQRVAEADLVIPGFEVRTTGVGFFTAVRLLPALLRAGRLPRGQTLGTLLDPELRKRWNTLKARYLPGNERVESLRPALAALELWRQALRRAGLENETHVAPLLRRSRLKRGAELRTPEARVEVQDPRALIREYTELPPREELPCFERVLARIENDLPVLQQRARAWSRGDIEALRRLNVHDVEDRCLDVLTATPRIAERVQEARRRLALEQFLALEGAVLRHRTSFTVLPMRELLGTDGALQRLRSRGYEVIEPQ